jgi:hypothetical protein
LVVGEEGARREWQAGRPSRVESRYRRRDDGMIGQRDDERKRERGQDRTGLGWAGQGRARQGGGGGEWWVVSGRAEWLRECKARKDSASRESQEQQSRRE